jgi:hypothetical protein
MNQAFRLMSASPSGALFISAGATTPDDAGKENLKFKPTFVSRRNVAQSVA